MRDRRLRVLITGGAGYLGSVVSDSLVRARHHVTVVDSLRSVHSQPAPPPIEFVLGDVRLADFLKPLVEQSDVIVPLAALIGESTDREPAEARSINLEAVSAIQQLLKPHQLLVYVSSCAIYAPTVGRVISEASPVSPTSYAGTLRLAAETSVLGHARSLVFRVGDLFGESRSRPGHLAIHRVIESAARQQVVTSPSQSRPIRPLHVRDLADAIHDCIERPLLPARLVLNFCTPETYSVQGLRRLVTETMTVGRIMPGIRGEPASAAPRIDTSAARSLGLVPRKELGANLDRVIRWLRVVGPGETRPTY